MNILYLSANMLSEEKISVMMKMSVVRVSRLLACDRSRSEVAKISYRISGESAQMSCMRLVPESIQTQAEIMRDKKIKPSTRLMAAQAIQDRALGKPKQEIDVNQKSSVRILLEQIQSGNSGPKPDYDAEFNVLSDPEMIPATTKAAEPDAVDDWIANNL